MIYLRIGTYDSALEYKNKIRWRNTPIYNARRFAEQPIPRLLPMIDAIENGPNIEEFHENEIEYDDQGNETNEVEDIEAGARQTIQNAIDSVSFEFIAMEEAQATSEHDGTIEPKNEEAELMTDADDVLDLMQLCPTNGFLDIDEDISIAVDTNANLHKPFAVPLEYDVKRDDAFSGNMPYKEHVSVFLNDIFINLLLINNFIT